MQLKWNQLLLLAAATSLLDIALSAPFRIDVIGDRPALYGRDARSEALSKRAPVFSAKNTPHAESPLSPPPQAVSHEVSMKFDGDLSKAMEGLRLGGSSGPGPALRKDEFDAKIQEIFPNDLNWPPVQSLIKENDAIQRTVSREQQEEILQRARKLKGDIDTLQ